MVSGECIHRFRFVSRIFNIGFSMGSLVGQYQDGTPCRTTTRDNKMGHHDTPPHGLGHRCDARKTIEKPSRQEKWGLHRDTVRHGLPEEHGKQHQVGTSSEIHRAI